ncbi:MAG: DUF2256 domain-containing protein [Verrucomicrobia bacterium]|nr:DUF2256 domain-containing protein [Verrucomicrobiota bacterium]
MGCAPPGIGSGRRPAPVSVQPSPPAMKKQQLPEKTCPVCGRPFKWRKKWQRTWEEVKFCSDRCRMAKHKARPG